MAITESLREIFHPYPLCYHCAAEKLFSIDSQTHDNIRISFCSVYPVTKGAQIGQQEVSSEPSTAGVKSKLLQVHHEVLQKVLPTSTSCFLAP